MCTVDNLINHDKCSAAARICHYQPLLSVIIHYYPPLSIIMPLSCHYPWIYRWHVQQILAGLRRQRQPTLLDRHEARTDSLAEFG